jgi:hypothetical protein
VTQLSSTQVLCRQAVEVDVIEFCKGIWDGEDYVPSVWEDWLQDPNGLLAAGLFIRSALSADQGEYGNAKGKKSQDDAGNTHAKSREAVEKKEQDQTPGRDRIRESHFPSPLE